MGGVVFAAIWSGSFIATKIALADIPPLWFAGMRLALSGIILALASRHAIARLWRQTHLAQRMRILLSGLLSQGVYLGATYWSLMHLPTGLVNIIVATLPIFLRRRPF